MTLDLSECWAKIDRAYKHLDSLESIARSDVHDEFKQIQLRAELHTQTGYYALSVATLPQAWRLQVGVILGDIVHNLRSALDYLFWKLFWHHVKRPGLVKPGTVKKVQFPIVDDAETFANKRREGPFNEIPFCCWAILDTAQPYKRRNPNERFLGLGGLRDLSDHDKHRVLTPFLEWSHKWDFTRGEFRGYRVVDIEPISGNQRLEIGTKVMRVMFALPHPDAKVEVAGHLNPSVHLPIETPKGTYAVGLFQTLDLIFGEVERVIEAISRLYNASP
jgi:hypothetical protein